MTTLKTIHWPQLLLGVVLGAALSFVATTIRDRYREFGQKKSGAWQVVNAWDEEVRINALALKLKTEIAAKLAIEPSSDLAQRSRLITQMRSTKLSTFALKTMAVHFASLEALGSEGSSVADTMGKFYRSLDRVEKEEADIFPQLACETIPADAQRYAEALHKQYVALEQLRGKTQERMDDLRTWLNAH